MPVDPTVVIEWVWKNLQTKEDVASQGQQADAPEDDLISDLVDKFCAKRPHLEQASHRATVEIEIDREWRVGLYRITICGVA